MKTKIFNLIVLDESGSMSVVHKETVSGCNETINTICSAQKARHEEMEQYISIYVFQEDEEHPSRYIMRDIPAAEARHITIVDYEPYGCTPLYDALGDTLTDLKTKCDSEKNAIGSVTIITDGMENASRRYSGPEIAKKIDALKELGWSFAFIGANIDVESTAASLHIDNSLEFRQDEEGMREMYERERRARDAYYDRLHNACCEARPFEMNEEEERIWIAQQRRSAQEGYFNDDHNS